MEEGDFERAFGRLEGKLDSVVGIVAELKGDFAKMERGRLTKLEVAFATLKSELSASTKSEANKSAMWASIISSIVSSVIAAVILYFILGK